MSRPCFYLWTTEFTRIIKELKGELQHGKISYRKKNIKKKQTSVPMRINIETYQKIEKAANECNYSLVEMLDVLVGYAINNLEIKG